MLKLDLSNCNGNGFGVSVVSLVLLPLFFSYDHYYQYDYYDDLCRHLFYTRTPSTKQTLRLKTLDSKLWQPAAFGCRSLAMAPRLCHWEDPDIQLIARI